MAYLIDSDWTIDHLADRPDAEALLSELVADGLAISIVTYMEIYEGILNAASQADTLARLERFLTSARIAPFDVSAARRCAEIRRHLRSQRRRVNGRALDLVVAATAIARDFTLVTRNIRDYEDIPDLKLYRGR